RAFSSQAEDGIRDRTVTGVQTCALPIWPMDSAGSRTVTAGSDFHRPRSTRNDSCLTRLALYLCRVRTHSRCDTSHGLSVLSGARSEERRVGKGRTDGEARALLRSKSMPV